MGYKRGVDMDNQEAIDRIKIHNEVHSRKEPFAVHITEALQMAIEALEKQVPEKPDLEGDGYWDGELVYDTGYCPRCRQDYEIEYHTPKFCEKCGQALDWN